MADDWPEWLSRPAGFLGNFGKYIEQVEDDLEKHFGDDSGAFETVKERAEARAPFFAAQAWLVERWGEHFPCPVCENTQWTVTEVGPSEPAGLLGFFVVCEYCANAMRVVPGYASREAPYRSSQLHLPVPEQ